MPSIKSLNKYFPFNKKKGHSAKIHEYHGYDNLRQSAYHPGTPNTNQYQPPPHTISHRHLLPQQLLMQPALQQHIPQAQQVLPNGLVNQCQCQHCSFQAHHQQQQNHQHQQHQFQQIQTNQQNGIGPAQVQIISPQPQMSIQMQSQSPAQIQHHQQCQSQQPCQFQSPAHQYVSHQVNEHVQTAPPVTQCVCQHCPFSHQHQQPLSPQQLQPQQLQPQQLQPQQLQPQQQIYHQQHQSPMNQQHQQMQSPQQQIVSPQHSEFTPTNISCQHHNSSNHLNNQLQMHQQHHTYNHTIQSQTQICPSNQQQQQQQFTPSVLSSSTPGPQQQQFSHQHPPQFQHQPVDQLNSQFHYHTIQPHQYQQQKIQQHQQQQQQHFRVQSLNQQQPQINYQSQHVHQQNTVQPNVQTQVHTSQQPQVESSYANMQSLMKHSLENHKVRQIQSKFQEHVYYNQKPEFTLPPYEHPPDYNTFMKGRRLETAEFNGQHMTHHSESLVMQKTKDSSYENLRTKCSPYGNLGIGRHEPGLTS